MEQDDPTIRDALRQALALAPSDPRGALDVLDSALQQGLADERASMAASLAKHAGVIATALGDLERAAAYYDEAIRSSPSDGYLNLARGEVSRRLGELGRARVAFERSLDLAREQNDSDLAEMAAKAMLEVSCDEEGC